MKRFIRAHLLSEKIVLHHDEEVKQPPLPCQAGPCQRSPAVRPKIHHLVSVSGSGSPCAPPR